MEVVSKCALRVAPCVWMPRAGAWVLTVVAKATYRLVPGVAELLPPEEQEGLNDEDNHWDDDPTQSLAAAADLVPFKAKCDVVLVGGAFAPNAKAASFVVRLRVAGIDKSIRVFGRRYAKPDGTIDAAVAQKVRLRYERAAGGPRTANPVGMAPGVRTEQGTPLPYLQRLDQSETNAFDRPIGFGPIAPTWPERVTKAPAGYAEWPMKAWRSLPLPPGLDPSFFNCAPADQQVTGLDPDQEIRLENLHPEHPLLVTRLPGIAPRATVERPGRPKVILRMAADTLWIDTSRGICTLTWRGQESLEAQDAPGKVIVETEEEESIDVSPIDTAEMLALSDARSAATQTLLLLPGPPTDGPGEPPRTLPFLQGPSELASAKPQDPPRRRKRSPADETHHLPTDIAHASALPFSATTKTEPPPPRKKTVPPSPLPPLVTPPAIVPRAPIAASLDQATVGERIAAVMKAVRDDNTFPEKEVVVASSSAAADGPSVKPRVGSLAGFKKAPPPPPAVRSAVEASDAVLDKAPPAGPRAWSVTAPVELLWFEPPFLEAVRRQPLWRDMLTTVRAKPRDADFDAGPQSPKRQEAKDRRELAAVLARGKPESTEDLGVALTNAVDEDGTFVPPLVLVAGDVEFPFEPAEALKALVTVVGPLAPPDDTKLKDALDSARSALVAPQLLHIGSLAERLTRQIATAFGASARSVATTELESLVERTLLDQRHFQRRPLFGQSWLRGFIAPVASSRAVPCYLPSDAAQKLPLLRRFRAQALAEVRPPLDRDDSGAVCLRLVALGRSLPGRW